jgi:hypothetical protein
MQSEVVKRITDYVATLKSSGAPHQQELAQDLSELMECVHRAIAPPPGLPANDDRDAQIIQLKANVGQLMDERDEARQQLNDTKEILDNATRNFEVRERDLKAQVEGHGIAKNVPEEEHAGLKPNAAPESV